MQQPTNATAAMPDYASWPGIEGVAAQVGVTPKLVNRWIVSGIKTEAGKVRLKGVKIGGRWKVNPAWVVEFVTATTLAAVPTSAIAEAAREPQPAKPSAKSEKAAVDACLARLKARGLSEPTPKRRRSITTVPTH